MDWFLYDRDLRHERPNNLSSSEKVLEIWKKSQRHLEEFSKNRKSQTCKKHPKVQSYQERKVEDIAQVKENSLRETWRDGRITELIKSQDQIEKSR